MFRLLVCVVEGHARLRHHVVRVLLVPHSLAGVLGDVRGCLPGLLRLLQRGGGGHGFVMLGEPILEAEESRRQDYRDDTYLNQYSCQLRVHFMLL